MSIGIGPNTIVLDGLIFYLDAGNNRSYAGSGTTCYDLSPNTKSGTLTNGPTYSSSNGGFFALDGGDDYIATNYGITSAGSYTVMNWVKLDSYSDYDMIFGQNPVLEYGVGSAVGGGANGRADLLFYSGNGSAWNPGLYFPNGTPAIGEWTHCTIVSTQGEVRYYKNGSLWDSLTDAGVTGGNSTKLYFGSRGQDLSWNYLHGAIANCLIYDRALTAAEVLQNFEVHKSRFGV
jgi:hypothetical protein